MTDTNSSPKLKPREKPHYVSNKDFYHAYVEWYKALAVAASEGKKEPEIPRYLCECIMKICTRLAYRPNFLNYSYREDMIGDAVENCIRVVKNFNAERSTNPFSYMTTIAYNAFLRRIEFEKRESYVKGVMIQQLPIEELMEIPEGEDDEVKVYHAQYVEFLRENNYLAAVEPKVRQKKEKDEMMPGSLDEFME